MDYPEYFSVAHRSPAALGLDGSFVTAAAFVSGCDVGSSWRLLDGSREWLVLELGRGLNLGWQPLVLLNVMPSGFRKSSTAKLDSEENAIAIDGLFRLLRTFWEVRNVHGLEWIQVRYAALSEELSR